MPDTRYRLIDGQLLSRLMRCPDSGGQHHTVRSLAAVTGISKSKISSMTRDRQTEVTADQAECIARAVGERRKALFLPASSLIANEDEIRKEGR